MLAAAFYRNSLQVRFGVSMKRKLYLDCLRILSAQAVVLLHVSCEGYNVFAVNTFEWQILNVFNSLSRWCVPMFVMISGVLFLDTNRDLSIRDIYQKYCFRIGIIIGLWMIGEICFLLAKNLNSHGVSWNSANLAVCAIVYPPGISWYLFMLVGLYAFAPILKKLVHDKNMLLYIIVVSFVLNAISVFSYMFPHGDCVTKQITLFGFERFTGFIGYFCAGAYFNLHFNNNRARTIIYWLAGLSGVITIVGSSGLSLYNNHPTQIFYHFLSPNVAFMTFGLFLFLQSLDMKKVSAKAQQVLFSFSKTTLLIYVLHIYIIVGFRVCGVSVRTLHVGFAPLIAVTVFVSSVCVSLLLLRNRWINRIFS